MKVLVTGGAGFIGSHLVRKLIELGNTVYCVDNESSDGHDSFAWNNNAINIFKDVNDLYPEDFEGIDVVFHLAAEVSIQRCISNPEKTFNSNVRGTFNVLDCSKKAGVKRFVFSSTSAIYGNGEEVNYFKSQNEESPQDCMNIYSTSKLMGENLCKLFARDDKMSIVCLRYFNVYGEGQANRGQYCPVIAVFKRQLLEKTPLTVVGDGKQTRDYIHVSDVVSANIKAAFTQNNFRGDVINIGTGKSHSVIDIAKLVAKDNGTIRFVPARKGEARHTLCDNSKAKALISWEPNVDLLQWLQDN